MFFRKPGGEGQGKRQGAAVLPRGADGWQRLTAVGAGAGAAAVIGAGVLCAQGIQPATFGVLGVAGFVGMVATLIVADLVWTS